MNELSIWDQWDQTHVLCWCVATGFIWIHHLISFDKEWMVSWMQCETCWTSTPLVGVQGM